MDVSSVPNVVSWLQRSLTKNDILYFAAFVVLWIALWYLVLPRILSGRKTDKYSWINELLELGALGSLSILLFIAIMGSLALQLILFVVYIVI